MPCPHYDIRIVKRNDNESAVAAAAYQSGDRLFSEYDQAQKYYPYKSEIVHKEILLPPHAPPEYADRNTLWNGQKYAEIWRQGWADTANRYLEANACPERLDLRSYARQGIDKIPTVHMGPAACQMEKKGIVTNMGNLNRDIEAANSLMDSIRETVGRLKGWVADFNKVQAAIDFL